MEFRTHGENEQTQSTSRILLHSFSFLFINRTLRDLFFSQKFFFLLIYKLEFFYFGNRHHQHWCRVSSTFNSIHSKEKAERKKQWNDETWEEEAHSFVHKVSSVSQREGGQISWAIGHNLRLQRTVEASRRHHFNNCFLYSFFESLVEVKKT